nr:ATP-binding protein [Chlorobaculum thiosulfatiphilum]
MTTIENDITELTQGGESLTLEFKSDLKGLPDRELVEAVVSLANTDGGEVLLGVEDDGRITGLHTRHLTVSGIPSLVANKTNPPIAVRVEKCEAQDKVFARITVPKSRQLVSTSDGALLRRRLKLDGTPEAVPFYPHEFHSAPVIARPHRSFRHAAGRNRFQPARSIATSAYSQRYQKIWRRTILAGVG